MFGSHIDAPGRALARGQQLHRSLDILQLLHWNGGILEQQRHTDTKNEEAATVPKPGADTRAICLGDYNTKPQPSSSKPGQGLRLKDATVFK